MAYCTLHRKGGGGRGFERMAYWTLHRTGKEGCSETLDVADWTWRTGGGVGVVTHSSRTIRHSLPPRGIFLTSVLRPLVFRRRIINRFTLQPLYLYGDKTLKQPSHQSLKQPSHQSRRWITSSPSSTEPCQSDTHAVSAASVAPLHNCSGHQRVYSWLTH